MHNPAALPEFDRAILARPIKDRADAESFIENICLHHMLWHFEDDPDDIVIGHSGELLFFESEWTDVRARVREMYALDWIICECPIGFALLCDDQNGGILLMDNLIKLLAEYCDAQKLEHMCANDMQTCLDLSPDQRAWLADYSATWERMEYRQQNAGQG